MQRLKTRSQFQAVLAGGTLARTTHFALHCVPLDSGSTDALMSGESQVPAKALFGVQDVWMGAMVPKRWAKRAVTRSAVKRQIYTVSTDALATFSSAAYVVRLRTAFDRSFFTSATSDALKAAVRLELQQLFALLASRQRLPGSRAKTS